jgi:hypothetical protein
MVCEKSNCNYYLIIRRNNYFRRSRHGAVNGSKNNHEFSWEWPEIGVIFDGQP